AALLLPGRPERRPCSPPCGQQLELRMLVPPNKRLKLTGDDRSSGSGVLCPGGQGLSSTTLAPAGGSPAAGARSGRRNAQSRAMHPQLATLVSQLEAATAHAREVVAASDDATLHAPPPRGGGLAAE